MRSAIILNLLDAKSGHLMNVSARVLGVTRSQNGWVYRCRWEQRLVRLRRHAVQRIIIDWRAANHATTGRVSGCSRSHRIERR